MKAIKKKALQAQVISDKMDKSILVTMSTNVSSLKYGKYLSRRTKVMVHDEGNLAKQGNIVLIEEGRPVSKCKNWRLVKVLD